MTKTNKNLIYGILAVFALVVLVVGTKFFPLDHNQNLKYNFTGKLVLAQQLDENLILEKIQQGKEYLLRILDKEKNGAYKYYYPASDTFENRLYTIYTSSTIYTLLKIYNFEKDGKLLSQVFKSADFILSMQEKDKNSKSYGAFYYSYYPNSGFKEKNFVVGTSAKTIFTLLKLYELSDDKKYLVSAQLAGNWLLTMQKTNGSMKSYMRYDGKKWLYGTKESLLYNGQVLSALSRLYLTTKEEKYLQGAENIAKYLAKKYEEAGNNYVDDDYREKNSISNSWIVMSLIDFYRANRDDYYKKIIFDMADMILSNQIDNPKELLTYGQWNDVYSTSGEGWISEVMSELYSFCKEENRNNCEKYKEAVVKAIGWLIQNTYSEDNMSGVKNPKMAVGGIPWDQKQKYIRTDSVCHALNGYVRIIGDSTKNPDFLNKFDIIKIGLDIILKQRIFKISY